MANLLEKLDRQAGRLLNVLDADLHPTLLRAATGEAFRDRNPHQHSNQGVQQEVPALDALMGDDCEPDCDGGIPAYPAPLRKASAFKR